MDDGEETAKTSVGLILLLWVAGLCAAAQFGKISVFFPFFQQAYPEAGPELGFLVSLIGVVGILLGGVAGPFVSAIGLGRAVVGGLTVGGALSLFQALELPLPVLLASRVVEGLSHLAIVVAAPALILRFAAPRHQANAMVLWSTFFGVAFALLAYLGTPVVQALGTEGLFVAHGVSCLAVAGALAPFVLKPGPVRGALVGDWTARGLLRRHLEIYRSPSEAAPAFGWFFYTINFVALLTVLPLFLPEAQRPIVGTLAPLVSIGFSLVIVALLLRVLSSVKVILVGFAASLLGVFTIASLEGVGALAAPIAMIALYAAFGLLQGASFAAIPELNKSSGSVTNATGALAQTGNLGNTIGPPLLLYAAAQFGLSGVVAVSALCFVLGAAAHLWLARRRMTAA
ncbi:MAG: MFS transporter [Alphaproteobacteria bacterium]|nr:MFS transporter [Alphaproteobacteria bacterium]